jgi:hypothetical protein
MHLSEVIDEHEQRFERDKCLFERISLTYDSHIGI